MGASILAAVAGFGHALYPLWLLARTRGTPPPEPPAAPDSWPSLSVVVPAFREERVIRQKVANLRGNGYPGELEVIVVAEDEATAAAARETDALVLDGGERLGKAAAMNRGAAAAQGELLAFTDANARLVPGALEQLTRWFADPLVGAAAGEKRVVGATRESVYWRFESWLKRREARTGTSIGVTGELIAVRRHLFRALPADTAADDLWLALDVLEQGGRIAYEPRARAEEAPPHGWHDDWERRTRVVVGALDVFWRRRGLLRPGSTGATDQLWGHRVVRLTAGPAAHAVLLALALGRARRSTLAALFAAGHVAGVAALLRERDGRTLTPPERLLAQVLFLQAVALGGAARYACGDRPALWRKPERREAAVWSNEA